MAPKRKGITVIGSSEAGLSAPVRVDGRVPTDGAEDVAGEHSRHFENRSQARGVVRIQDNEPRPAGSGGGAMLPTGGTAASMTPQPAPAPRRAGRRGRRGGRRLRSAERRRRPRKGGERVRRRRRRRRRRGRRRRRLAWARGEVPWTGSVPSPPRLQLPLASRGGLPLPLCQAIHSRAIYSLRFYLVRILALVKVKLCKLWQSL